MSSEQKAGTERSAYRFPICLICECEVDESNEGKHQGPLHDVQTLAFVPASALQKEKAEREAVEAKLKLTDDARAEAFEGEEQMHDRALVAEKKLATLIERIDHVELALSGAGHIEDLLADKPIKEEATQ
jgi:hypothetical protein